MSRLSAFITTKEKEARNSVADRSRIYMAEVMDARSPSKTGEILVWVLNADKDRTDPENWILAKPVVQSFGLTINNSAISSDYFETQVTSYGNWSPVPYVGSYVFIFYPNVQGGNATPYYFGSPIQQSNMMLPGISYDMISKSNQTDYTPTCEVNCMAEETSSPKPYTPLQAALTNQGLDKDRLRGISTASSYRDIPSHCYGFLSPLGNQMVIDDGWSIGDNNISWKNDPRVNDEDNSAKDDYGAYHSKKYWVASLEEADKENKLNRFHGGFRFRTRNGTQLLILDAGNIYMINKDGTAWAELSEDGYIDCYSHKGISCASDGDINLFGKNINIEATNMINMKAGKGYSLQTEGNVNIQSGDVVVSNNISVESLQSNFCYAGNFQSPNAEISGIFAGTLQGTAYYATSAGVVPIDQPLPEVDSHTVNRVISTGMATVKQKVGESEYEGLVSRKPTHEPWAEHDRNDRIPELIIKQAMKTEEKPVVNNTVISNIAGT